MEKQYKVELKGKLSTKTYSLEGAKALVLFLKNTLKLEDKDVAVLEATNYDKGDNK